MNLKTILWDFTPIMPPYKRHTPLPLEELCLSHILNYLEGELLFCYHVRKYERMSLLLRRRRLNSQALMSELMDYFKMLPPLLNEMVRQNLTHRLLKLTGDSQAEISTKIGLLDIVLSKEVKYLDLKEEKLMAEYKFWRTVISKCSGLERFAVEVNLRGTKGGHMFRPQVCNLVSNCSMLKELVLKDNVMGADPLAAIGRTCRFLRVLDITGSEVQCMDIVQLCVKAPCSHKAFTFNVDLYNKEDFYPLCQTLRVVAIGKTQVRSRGAAFLIRYIPNLETLGSCNFLASGLKKLFGIKKSPTTALKIRKAFYRGVSDVKLKVLGNCCPNVEFLYLGADKNRRIPESLMHPFKKVRSLTVENISAADVLQGLNCLSNIVELQVQTLIADYTIVGQCCTHLQKLCISVEPSREFTTSPRYEHMFTELKELKVTCPISRDCASLFFTNATKLRVVEMARIRDLNDCVFALWLKKNPLQHLQSLMLRYVEMTRSSVDLLLVSCPQLRKLGELGGWDIRSWERHRLKNAISMENYDLELVFYAHNPLNVTTVFYETWSDDDFSGPV